MTTLTPPMTQSLATSLTQPLTLAPTPTAPRVTFRNLLRAESRKTVDTLAARIFLSVVLLLAVAVTILVPIFAEDQLSAGTPWTFFVDVPQMVLVMFLPIIAIMLFAAEWSQNSVLSTFVAEPRRERVLLAKTVAAVAVAVAGYLFALAVGLVAAGGFDSATDLAVSWDVDWHSLLGMLLTILFVTFQGAALGLLLMNTPLAIIVYVTAPAIIGLLPNFGEKATEFFTWISPVAPLNALSALEFTGNDLAKFATVAAIWVVVPGVLGWIRQTRAEVS